MEDKCYTTGLHLSQNNVVLNHRERKITVMETATICNDLSTQYFTREESEFDCLNNLLEVAKTVSDVAWWLLTIVHCCLLSQE